MKNSESNSFFSLFQSSEKQMAVLLDPDSGTAVLKDTINSCNAEEINCLFIGGSLLTSSDFNRTVNNIKQATDSRLIIFPGSEMQVSEHADGILLLSLISGRNPDLLIGKHVNASFMLENSGLEIIPTGYILIDGGKPTSVSYMSNTTPIPADKPDIAAATALAGKQLGLKVIYMDAGSGAIRQVPSEIVTRVKKTTGLPLVIGGGIRSASQAEVLYQAGADMLVIGNGAESKSSLISEINTVRKKMNEQVQVMDRRR